MTTSHREFIFASYGARETDEGTDRMSKQIFTVCILAIAGATAAPGTAGHTPIRDAAGLEF